MVCTKDSSSYRLPAIAQMDLSNTSQKCSRLHSSSDSCQNGVQNATCISLNSRTQSALPANTVRKFPTHTWSGVRNTNCTHHSKWFMRCLIVVLVSTSLWPTSLGVSVINATDLVNSSASTKSEKPTTDMVQSYTTPLPDIVQLFTPASKLDIRECEKQLDTPEQLLYLCGKHSDMIPIFMYAESLGRKTCELAFKNELWNCSGFSILKEPNVTKNEVYKESAYVYALSVAVIAHSVAKACSQNLLKSCTCDNIPVDFPTPGSEQVTYTLGCSDNVDYGIRVAETFLSKRSSGRSLKLDLVNHNIGATKLLIRDIIVNSQPTCKCHGVSGSCTFQTCHSELPEFSSIADQIKQKYAQACMVASNGHSKNSWVSKCGRDFSEHDLIYREDTKWCVIDPSKGSVGVSKRECINELGAPNSCENICRQCGRIPIEKTEFVKEESQCLFHFCCKIHCRVIQTLRTYLICS